MLGDRTGPPQKTAVQLAAGGGHLEVLEELARYTTQVDWLVRDDWGWTLLHEVAHIGAGQHIIKVRHLPFLVCR